MEMSGYKYTASAGESPDSIAREVYGDEKYVSELLCANPEHALKVRMEGGEMWRLPVIEVPPDDMTEMPEKAPWKEG